MNTEHSLAFRKALHINHWPRSITYVLQIVTYCAKLELEKKKILSLLSSISRSILEGFIPALQEFRVGEG